MTPIDSFSGPYRFLSNFYPAPCHLGDFIVFPTVEHAYQAAKTLDIHKRFDVRACTTPGGAKALGRTLVLRPDWEEFKINVMRYLLDQKFPALIGHGLTYSLLSTGERELIEGNTWGDTFWGVCRGAGENHLGKLLMELRAQRQTVVSA